MAERNWSAPLAAGLLAYTLLFTGVSLASYVTASSDADSAQAAACVIETEGLDGDLHITDTGEAAYAFTVSNQNDGQVSEVALTYDIVVRLDAPLPDTVTVLLDGRTGIGSGAEICFEDAGTFAADRGDDHRHELEFTAAGIADAARLGVEIAVRAEQID